MRERIAPGAVYPFELDAGTAGIAADLRFRIEDDDDVVVLDETAVGIVEFTPRFYRMKQAAPAESGFYTAIWRRASTGAEATEQFEVTSTMPEPGTVARPSVAEVAAELRARTKGGELGGSELGTFTETTRPKASQVEELISNAWDEVIPRFPSGQIPERSMTAFKAAVRLRAALKIELSYFPEQTGTENSPYLQLRRDVENAEQLLVAGAALTLDETNPEQADGPIVGL